MQTVGPLTAACPPGWSSAGSRGLPPAERVPVGNRQLSDLRSGLGRYRPRRHDGRGRETVLMQVRRTRGASHQRSGAMCLAVLVIAGTLALAGCGQSARPKTARATDCGTSHTAANVPVEVAVERGQVACSTALTVESDYAKAIVQGKAPGNGGGGPVTV